MEGVWESGTADRNNSSFTYHFCDLRANLSFLTASISSCLRVLYLPLRTESNPIGKSKGLTTLGGWCPPFSFPQSIQPPHIFQKVFHQRSSDTSTTKLRACVPQSLSTRYAPLLGPQHPSEANSSNKTRYLNRDRFMI